MIRNILDKWETNTPLLEERCYWGASKYGTWGRRKSWQGSPYVLEFRCTRVSLGIRVAKGERMVEIIVKYMWCVNQWGGGGVYRLTKTSFIIWYALTSKEAWLGFCQLSHNSHQISKLKNAEILSRTLKIFFKKIWNIHKLSPDDVAVLIPALKGTYLEVGLWHTSFTASCNIVKSVCRDSNAATLRTKSLSPQ